MKIPAADQPQFQLLKSSYGTKIFCVGNVVALLSQMLWQTCFLNHVMWNRNVHVILFFPFVGDLSLGHSFLPHSCDTEYFVMKAAVWLIDWFKLRQLCCGCVRWKITFAFLWKTMHTTVSYRDPQDPVLGPFFFYLGNIPRKHYKSHCHADDSQIYLSVNPDETNQTWRHEGQDVMSFSSTHSYRTAVFCLGLNPSMFIWPPIMTQHWLLLLGRILPIFEHDVYLPPIKKQL